MKRYFLNLTLLIIFLLVMSFHFLPRILHEIFGVVMFLPACWHLFLNRRWLANFYRGKFSRRKIILTLINFSTLATFAIIFVTGVFASNHLFSDFVSPELHRNITIRQLHTSFAYVLMILLGLHIGLHWREIFKLKVKSGKLKIILAAVTICLGIYGAFLNQVGDRILMKHIFATAATELPLPAFWILFLATMAVYSITMYFIDKKFLK